MNTRISKLILTSRQARKNRDWAAVSACADQLISLAPEIAEGYFLRGLAARVNNQPRVAMEAFEKALTVDKSRYDAAIELANQYSFARRNGEAANLLSQYEGALNNSPLYLDLAGTVYTDIGLSQKAWPLFKRANEIQPGVDIFKANLATCAVFLGKIDEARELYQSLLDRQPNHRKNHYQLSRLQKAKDSTHIEQMKQIIRDKNDTPERAIPLNFAIAKELEDLEQWDESFKYYSQAGDTVCQITKYDVAKDIQLIDSVIETCSADWLNENSGEPSQDTPAKTPIFIVGLPRTGTTLTERIISSHSKVSSLGETLFIQMILRQESGMQSTERMTTDMIRGVARKDISKVAESYLRQVEYRLGDEPFFIDKLPINFLYTGFIAKAFPDARIIHQVRNPMDACFAMFKQPFTWAYKFSYSLQDLGRYYVAYDRLRKHWQTVLGDRLIEVQYENLVSDQEGETTQLLEQLGLDFESACLEFDKNAAPSATASSVQVRSKIHSGSVQRWKQFEQQLQPLKEHLESAGIPIE